MIFSTVSVETEVVVDVVVVVVVVVTLSLLFSFLQATSARPILKQNNVVTFNVFISNEYTKNKKGCRLFSTPFYRILYNVFLLIGKLKLLFIIQGNQN